MAKIVIFGAGQIAELAEFYLRRDSEHEPVAFTVDAQYLELEKLCGLPVVAFEELAAFSPNEHRSFVALSYSKVNQIRAEKLEQVKRAGYAPVSYVSSKATVWPGLEVGGNCFVLEDNTIQPFVRIGSNVTLWSGNHIGHHAVIGDHCFISSHVVVSGGVTVGERCFLGVNATIRDHVRLGSGTVVGAGALILRDTEPNQVLSSSPAKLSKVPSDRLTRL